MKKKYSTISKIKAFVRNVLVLVVVKKKFASKFEMVVLICKVLHDNC